MNDLVSVKSFGSRIEAEIARGLLAANKIASIVLADDAGRMYPSLSQVSEAGVKLLVRKKNLKKALGVLRTHK